MEKSNTPVAPDGVLGAEASGSQAVAGAGTAAGTATAADASIGAGASTAAGASMGAAATSVAIAAESNPKNVAASTATDTTTAQQLLVFARPPVLGRVKTRLAAALGAEVALGIYRRLLALTQRAVAAAAVPTTVWLAEAPAPETLPHDELPEWPGLPWRVQPPAADLGERMAAAFAAAFAAGAGRVAVIGTDCPALTAALLTQAFAELAAYDVVLGPAADGGYYLLGLRQPRPALFAGIAWSSPTVRADTLARAAALGLSVALLPTLHDVDEAADLAHWPGWRGD